MSKHSALAAVAAILFGATMTAKATPVTFFGEDLGNGKPVTAHPQSDAARNSFFSNLVGVGTETFEGFSTGTTTPISTVFGVAGTATITGNGSIQSGPSTSNQYPISGTKYFSADGTFTLTFSAPVSAFGFYGTDIGDQGASFNLALKGSAGASTLNVPIKIGIGTGSAPDGSALYFGFYDAANTYTSISFVGAGTSSGLNDVFGFDNFSIGSRAQVIPTNVPEPMTLAVLASGLFGLGLTRQRKRG